MRREGKGGGKGVNGGGRIRNHATKRRKLKLGQTIKRKSNMKTTMQPTKSSIIKQMTISRIRRKMLLRIFLQQLA